MAALPVVPVMIGMAALSAASAGVQMQQQKYTAQAEQDLQAQNNAELDKAAIRQYSDLSVTEDEIQEQSALESLEQQKQYIQARGRQLVMAGASGTYGSSVDAMLRDLTQTKGKNLQIINRNRESQLKDIQTQAEQIRYGARAQKGNRIFNKPTLGQFAVTVGAAGASGAMSGLAATKGGG